ncbi:MAG: flagellar biosynthetic protein FliO [Lachnospiraceae bacterium]|nr:flagellar biosynthetic protein FliO [Lachnospiraceae bacterium]
MILMSSGAVESVVQLFTAIIIFVFVLFITFWTTRFIAKYQKQTMTSGNMEVVETTRIAPNKYLQIVRVGDRYFVIGIGKDTITMLSEIEAEQLNLKTDSEGDIQPIDFRAILEKAKNSRKKQADKDE